MSEGGLRMLAYVLLAALILYASLGGGLV